MATMTTPSSYEEQWVPRSFKSRGSIISGTACTSHGLRGGRSCRLTRELQRGISHPLLGSISRWMILQQKGGTLTPLITGKEVPMVNRNSLMSEPSIVVIDDPPFLTTTQVQNIPHPGSRGPMAGTIELKARCEDRKDNSSCMFLFICVSKNKMLDSRFKNRANLFNSLVNSMEDHTIRVPTRINPAAFFSQHRLPILERRGTVKGSGERRDPLRDEYLHLYQIILE